MTALHAAERAYEAICCETLGVTRHDVDLDLMRLGLIAAACADTARKAWREYRVTVDTRASHEFDLEFLARQFTDAIADTLGMSREAAVVLDELAKAEFA